MSDFVERMQLLVSSSNLSLLKLEKEIKITNVQLGKYLSGNFFPSLKNALKITEYYKCSLDYLFGKDNLTMRYQITNEPSFDKFLNRYFELLKINNLNHNKLSLQTAFTRNGLVYWKRKKSLPSMFIILKLANGLNIPIEYLIGRIDNYEERNYGI